MAKAKGKTVERDLRKAGRGAAAPMRDPSRVKPRERAEKNGPNYVRGASRRRAA